MPKRLFLILLSLLTLRFYPFLFGKTFFFGDNYSLLVPGKIFTAQWLHQGIFPLWNPYVLAGISWIGDINQSLFSLSTVFFSIFPVGLALNLTILFYCIVTFIGMYVFAKNFLHSERSGLIAATVWTLSSFVSGGLNNITVLQSLAIIPWVLFSGVFYWRKPIGIVATAIAIVCMILGGYPQFVPYAVLLASALSFEPSLWKRWMLSWTLIGGLALGLSAFAWMPFVETLQNSTRTLQTSVQATQGGLQLSDLLSFVLPSVFADPQLGMKWGPVWNVSGTTVPYLSWIGIVLLSLVFWKRQHTKRDLFFLSLCFFALVFSFASIFPVFRMAQQLLPFFKATRGPQLALVLIDVIASLWIADLIGRFQSNWIEKKWIWRIVWISVVILCIRFVLNWQFESMWTAIDTLMRHKLSQSAFHTILKDRIILHHFISLVVIHLLLLATSLFALQKKHTYLLLFVLAFEMHIFTSSQLFFAPTSVYPSWKEMQVNTTSTDRVLLNNGNQPYTDFATYWEAMSVRAPFSDSYVEKRELQQFSQLQRMRNTYTPNWNMVYGLHSLNGYVAFVQKDMNVIWNTNQGNPAINFLPEIDVTDPKLAHWGVSSFAVDNWFPHTDVALPQIEKKDTLVRYALPTASRFRMNDGTAVPKAMIYETPNIQKISIENAQKDSSLLVADRFDSNWNATINGKQIEILNEHGIRKIQLEQGKNEVTLRYRSKTFQGGQYISLLTIIITLVSLQFTRKRTSLKTD